MKTVTREVGGGLIADFMVAEKGDMVTIDKFAYTPGQRELLTGVVVGEVKEPFGPPFNGSRKNKETFLLVWFGDHDRAGTPIVYKVHEPMCRYMKPDQYLVLDKQINC